MCCPFVVVVVCLFLFLFCCCCCCCLGRGSDLRFMCYPIFVRSRQIYAIPYYCVKWHSATSGGSLFLVLDRVYSRSYKYYKHDQYVSTEQAKAYCSSSFLCAAECAAGGGGVCLKWKQNGPQQDGGQVDKCSVCVAFYNISSRVSCLIAFCTLEQKTKA